MITMNYDVLMLNAVRALLISLFCLFSVASVLDEKGRRKRYALLYIVCGVLLVATFVVRAGQS